MVNPFSNLEDEKLMKLYIDGEEMAFTVIYSRYSNNVYTYLYKRLSDSQIVDDIFQSIFIKFHKSRHLYKSEYPLIKWIYTISRSELLDHMKKRKLKTIEFKEEILQHEEIITGPESLDLDSEDSLTQKEKDALKLRYYSEEDFLDISTVLETSENNARKLISRALQKLRKKYQGDAND